MKLHFDKIQDFAGFAAENSKIGETTVKILTRALLTSDDPEFYKYTEQISNIFLSKAQIFVDSVHQFLVIIHNDLSADLYINDFQVQTEIQVKRDVKQGEMIMQKDVADIRKVKFPQISITETDKIIYCFKVGWRFGLFFDLTPRIQPVNTVQPIKVENLDIKKAMLSIGEIYRYLSFYHVYKTLESDTQFEEMMKDGWFPFVEIIAEEYKKLSEIYHNKFDFEIRIKALVDSFNEEKINKITEKWWKKQVFVEKKNLIEAGINAYLQNTQGGFVNCIKNLSSEIEGILRNMYLSETGKGNNIKSSELIEFITKKAKDKTGSDYSLLLPLPFLKYLKNVVFSNFNIETGEVDMSRNSSSHGVAKINQYTKERALQFILIIDQIYFYC